MQQILLEIKNVFKERIFDLQKNKLIKRKINLNIFVKQNSRLINTTISCNTTALFINNKPLINTP